MTEAAGNNLREYVENGGTLVACSDAFYGSAARLVEPGRKSARHT